MSEHIDDAVSKRIEREYQYAEQRVAYNMERGNWDVADRWFDLAVHLWDTARCLCWEHEDA